MKRTIAYLVIAIITLLSGLVSSASAEEKIKVLIIDGHNNHNWQKMTPIMKATLEGTGRFTVAVSRVPRNNDKKDKWDAWKPEFAKYDVIVSNYNDCGKCRWPKERRDEFVKFMADGGGFVPVHGADNSSADWPEYNEMIAVGGWGGRTAKDGSLLRKRNGKWITDPAPKGRSGCHGKPSFFTVDTENADHPIMKGFPSKWLHEKEELYASLRGPCKNVAVLASGMSTMTKEAEPVAMVITYGKGRVFHLTLGHVGNKEPIICVGFQTLLARGTEFAATGKVTIPIPEGFPTEDKTSVIEPDQVNWKGKG